MDGTLLNPAQDHEFCDKIIADDGVAKMRLLSANRKRTGQPFFQAVGFVSAGHPPVFSVAQARRDLLSHPTS